MKSISQSNNQSMEKKKNKSASFKCLFIFFVLDPEIRIF